MKNLIKKISMLSFAIIFTTIMVFTLAACDGDASINEPTPSDPSTEATSEPTPETTPETTPEPASEPTPEPTPESPEEEIGVLERGLFPVEFSAEDFFGNTVTQETMGEHELFFIYAWTTWCPSCITTIPVIVQLVEQFGDKVGFVMLLLDMDNVSSAIEIYSSLDFPDSNSVISVCGMTTFDLQLPFMQELNTGFVPTTVIIDAQGNVLEQLIGGQAQQYNDILNTLLSAS